MRQTDSALYDHFESIATDGFWDWNIPADYEYMSPRFWEILGFKPEEKKHHPSEWQKLIFPEDLKIALANFENHIGSHGEKPFDQKVRYRHKSGSTVWVRCVGEVIEWGTDGNPIRMIGIHQDITDYVTSREALETSEAFLREAQRIGKIGNFSYDTSTHQIRWSEQMFSIFPERIEDGEPDFERHRSSIHPDDLALWEEALKNSLEKGENYEIRFRTKNLSGEEVWVHSRCEVEKDSEGRVTRVYGTCQDITELVRRGEEAQQAERVKIEFLANTSHEIRTPMNGVIGMADLLKTTELTEEQLDMVESISTCGEDLIGILNDILDYSRIQAEGTKLESVLFNPLTVAKQTLDLFKGKASEKGTELFLKTSGDREKEYMGDPLRFSQILRNLVGNSVKFTKEGSITLTIEQRSEAIDVVVEDDGIGIPIDRQESIFHPFEQADGSTTRRYGGTGMGLTISQRLVELMGGKILCESAPGRGTKMSFSVHLNQVKKKSRRIEEAQSAPRGDYSRLRVLVAEDQSSNQKVIEMMLKRFGIKPHMVSNGMDAVRQCGEVQFDLVLMDIQMPEVDGLTAAHEILAGSNKPSCLVAVTANVLVENRQECLDAGMHDFLAKPISINAVANLLKKWFPSPARPTPNDPPSSL